MPIYCNVLYMQDCRFHGSIPKSQDIIYIYISTMGILAQLRGFEHVKDPITAQKNNPMNWLHYTSKKSALPKQNVPHKCFPGHHRRFPSATFARLRKQGQFETRLKHLPSVSHSCSSCFLQTNGASPEQLHAPMSAAHLSSWHVPTRTST